MRYWNDIWNVDMTAYHFEVSKLECFRFERAEQLYGDAAGCTDGRHRTQAVFLVSDQATQTNPTVDSTNQSQDGYNRHLVDQ